MGRNQYILGHTEPELQRLMFQSTLLESTTKRLLLSAGLKAGMRVLDLGCGPGDVSLLVAELVGPKGSVTGIDPSSSVIAVARERARNAEIDNIVFYPVSLAAFDSNGGFDFIIGRYVLMYQPQPLIFLGRAASLLRAKGILAFHEVDITQQPLSTPFLPLFNQICANTLSAFQHSLPCHDVALSLATLLQKVTLASPEIFCEIPLEFGVAENICRLWGESFRSVNPQVKEIISPSGEKISILELVDELIKESSGEKAQVEFMRQVCAWSRLP